MKQWNAVVLAVGLAVGVSACAGDKGPDAERKDGQGAAVGTSGAAKAANDDSEKEFVADQLSMGLAEIELGKLAQQRGNHPAVKRYGEMMVRDHENAGNDLKRMTKNTSSHGSQAEHGDHAELREELAKLSGADFDGRYIDRMIDDHEKMLRDVENKAEKSDSAPVREWATKTLPAVRQHLEEAKNIKKTLDETPKKDR